MRSRIGIAVRKFQISTRESIQVLVSIRAFGIKSDLEKFLGLIGWNFRRLHGRFEMDPDLDSLSYELRSQIETQIDAGPRLRLSQKWSILSPGWFNQSCETKLQCVLQFQIRMYSSLLKKEDNFADYGFQLRRKPKTLEQGSWREPRCCNPNANQNQRTESLLCPVESMNIWSESCALQIVISTSTSEERSDRDGNPLVCWQIRTD